MKRREFVAGLGSAAAWPLAARAQQGERVRRIGVLLPAAADDARFQTLVGAFLQELALLGRTIGRNVSIDTRWATANAADIRRHAAAELASISGRWKERNSVADGYIASPHAGQDQQILPVRWLRVQPLHRRALENSPSRPYDIGISGVDRPTIGGQFSGGGAHAEPAIHCCECQN